MSRAQRAGGYCRVECYAQCKLLVPSLVCEGLAVIQRNAVNRLRWTGTTAVLVE